MFSQTGEGDEKGKVMGIFRSLGALARALGPATACTGKYFPSLRNHNHPLFPLHLLSPSIYMQCFGATVPV